MALTKTQVSQLYVSLFGRASEGAGNTYWQTQNAASADTNTNRTNTATEMLNLAVVKTYFGVTDYATTANVQTVVEAIYLNTLGKTYAQDTAGVDYWVAQVAGGVSMGSMVNSLIVAINAPANRVAAADIAASNTFNNKVSVSDYTADNLSALTTTTIFTAYLTGVTDAASTVVTAKAAALADVPVVANPGSSFVLTSTTDVMTGTTADDTFTAGEGAGGVATLTAGDTIDGGAGIDTIRFIETDAVTALPIGLSISNVEIFTMIGGGAITLDTTALTSLTTVNTTNSAAAQTITAGAAADINTARAVAADTAVTVNGGKNVLVTDAGSANAISVGVTTAAAGTVTSNQSHIFADGADDTGGTVIITGGTTVTSAQTINFAASNAAAQLIDNTNFSATFGATTVTGGANTTAVTANQTNAQAESDSTTIGQAGIVNGAVTVTDANNASLTAASSIATVTVNSGAVVTVESSALTTLNLSGTITSVDADDLGALTTVAVTTLALNVNGLTTTGAIVIDTDITALTLDSSTAASTIADLDMDGVVTLTVTGNALVTLTAQKDAAFTTINSTNTGGVSLGTALAVATVFTGGSGNDAISIGATTGAQTMGAGNDTVTISSGTVGTGGSVNGGAGTADKLIMTDALAAAADGTSVFNGSFTNFEVLEISDSFVSDTLDLDGLNNVDTVILALGANTATIGNLDSGGTVQFNTTDTAGTTTINVDSAVTGSADILNLVISNTGDVYVLATVTAANVETINITANDADVTASGSVAAINTATLTAAQATTVNVSGNNGLTLTATGSVLVTTFDASGVVANNTTNAANSAGTTDTLANLAVTYASLNATANADVTITGGAGNDTLTGSTAAVNRDTIDGGAGADIITGGTGADIITGGIGADVIKGGTGADAITLTETTAALDIVILSGGLTADTVTGFNTGATSADEIQFDISEIEGAGLTVVGVTMDIVALSTGASSGAGQGTIQEIADQAGGNAVATTAGNDIYVLLTETYASLAALETGLETGDHELTVHADVAVADVFFVMYSDGTDAHVAAISVAVDGGADIDFGDLVATNLATLKGISVLNAGDIAVNNFEYIA